MKPLTEDHLAIFRRHMVEVIDVQFDLLSDEIGKILVTAAADDPPTRLLDQLGSGGRLVMPMGDEGSQLISLIEKQADGNLTTRKIMPARFTRLETV